jgi:hypothetical protein
MINTRLFALAVSLSAIASALPAQVRLGPGGRVQAFLSADPSDNRFAVSLAFSPCPDKNAANDAVVREFLKTTIPSSHLAAAARGFARGLEACNDQRALAWLLDHLESSAPTNPVFAGQILLYLDVVGHKSPAYAAALERLLTAGVRSEDLQDVAARQARRILGDAGLTRVFVAAYPEGKLQRRVSESLIAYLGNRQPDLFLTSVAGMVRSRPDILTDSILLYGVYQIVAPRDTVRTRGPGAEAILGAMKEAESRLGASLDSVARSYIRRIERQLQSPR